MSVQATVLVPTYNHGPTLRPSVQSALDQTVQDIEVFIVGDGLPAATRSIVEELRAKDSRITFFSHPKGPRHGEIFRHEALNQARGKIVCYLSDDDLWLPGHIAYSLELLKDGNFAHSLPLRISTSGLFETWPGNLSLSFWREYIMNGHNFIPLSTATHTLRLYKSLPFGWRTTPKGVHTDLYMWQQILAHPACRPVSGTRPTVLHFHTKGRDGWTPRKRADELRLWSQKMKNPRFFGVLLIDVVHHLATERARFHAEKDDLKKYIQKIGWRSIWGVYNWLLDQPLTGSMLKKRAKPASDS